MEQITVTYDQQVDYLLATHPSPLTPEERVALRPQLLQIIFLLEELNIDLETFTSQTATTQTDESCYNDSTVH
jgi:hypothetical protein